MSKETEASAGTLATYRQLVEMATDPLFVVDADGRFEAANQAFLDFVGYERSELLGMPILVLLPDDAAGDWKQRLTLLQSGETTETDPWSTRLRTKNGTEAPATLQFSAVDGAGTDGFAGRATDERVQTRRENRLNILNRVLRHNIRNRMNIVIGNASTLQDVDDEGYRTLATQVVDIGNEIISISDKARKAQKHLDIPDDADCRRDLVEMTENVVTQYGITRGDADVTTTLPETARARAPPSFGVALTELLENAAVHHESGNGPATVAIECDADVVAVHVRDECPPIPDAVVECLEQGREDPLDHNEGLGLWIVHWVVETVGGDLSFGRRDDDAGNEVTLTFDALEE